MQLLIVCLKNERRYNSVEECKRHMLDQQFHRPAIAFTQDGLLKKAPNLLKKFAICEESVSGFKLALTQLPALRHLMHDTLAMNTMQQDYVDKLCLMSARKPVSIDDFALLVQRCVQQGLLCQASRRSTGTLQELGLCTNAVGHASYRGQAAILLQLLEALPAGMYSCTDWPDTLGDDLWYDWRCDAQTSALHLAARGGHQECCRLLLQHGVDLCAIDGSHPAETSMQIAQTELVAGFLSLHRLCPRGCGQYSMESDWHLHLMRHCKTMKVTRAFLGGLNRLFAHLFSRDLVTRIFSLAGMDLAAKWHEEVVDIFA